MDAVSTTWGAASGNFFVAGASRQEVRSLVEFLVMGWLMPRAARVLVRGASMGRRVFNWGTSRPGRWVLGTPAKPPWLFAERSGPQQAGVVLPTVPDFFRNILAV